MSPELMFRAADAVIPMTLAPEAISAPCIVILSAASTNVLLALLRLRAVFMLAGALGFSSPSAAPEVFAPPPKIVTAPSED